MNPRITLLCAIQQLPLDMNTKSQVIVSVGTTVQQDAPVVPPSCYQVCEPCTGAKSQLPHSTELQRMLMNCPGRQTDSWAENQNPTKSLWKTSCEARYITNACFVNDVELKLQGEVSSFL